MNTIQNSFDRASEFIDNLDKDAEALYLEALEKRKKAEAAAEARKVEQERQANLKKEMEAAARLKAEEEERAR